MRKEDVIIAGLIRNEDYSRKVIPFLDLEYFKFRSDRFIVDACVQYFTKFNALPTVEVVKAEAVSSSKLSDADLKEVETKLNAVKGIQLGVEEWMLDQTESFCKEQSLTNAIRKSIGIIEGSDKQLSPDAIPKLLQDALAVTFDTAVGHDYFDDVAQRYEFYNKVEERIPFDIAMLNAITKGGLPRKTLSLLASESGGGKTLVKCHLAANFLRQGFNVLFISMEMSQERIAQRIDANMLNVTVDELTKMGKDQFVSKVEKIQEKARGRLIVKEYPTGGAHSGHFRALIEELKIKRNFKPDVIVVDYLGICASAKMKMTGGVNTYTYIKSVAEELRALAVEYNAVVISSSQVNRNGYSNSEIEATDTSDSMGIVHTADLYLAIIRTGNLDELGQVMFKQLKNRYSDPAENRKFVVGINRAKMKLFDLEAAAQRVLTPAAKRDVSTSSDPIVIKKPKVDTSDFDFS